MSVPSTDNGTINTDKLITLMMTMMIMVMMMKMMTKATESIG